MGCAHAPSGSKLCALSQTASSQFDQTSELNSGSSLSPRPPCLEKNWIDGSRRRRWWGRSLAGWDEMSPCWWESGLLSLWVWKHILTQWSSVNQGHLANCSLTVVFRIELNCLQTSKPEWHSLFCHHLVKIHFYQNAVNKKNHELSKPCISFLALSCCDRCGRGRWVGEKGVQGQSPHDVLCCGPHLGYGDGGGDRVCRLWRVRARRSPETSWWTLHKGDEENKNATPKKSTSRHVG